MACPVETGAKTCGLPLRSLNFEPHPNDHGTHTGIRMHTPGHGLVKMVAALYFGGRSHDSSGQSVSFKQPHTTTNTTMLEGTSFVASSFLFFCLVGASLRPYCGWTKSILHHFESMGTHGLFALTPSFQGFLGGTGFRPSTVCG